MAKIDGRVKRADVYRLAAAADVDHRTARQYLEGEYVFGEAGRRCGDQAKALRLAPVGGGK